MSLNFGNNGSKVTERVVDEIERRLDRLPGQARDARDTFAGWGQDARRFARENPGKALLGAFALGFILARVSRHA